MKRKRNYLKELLVALKPMLIALPIITVVVLTIVLRIINIVKVCPCGTFYDDATAEAALQTFQVDGYDAVLWNNPKDSWKLNVTYYEENQLRTYHSGIPVDYQKKVVPFLDNKKSHIVVPFENESDAISSLKNNRFKWYLIWCDESDAAETVNISVIVDENENVKTFYSDIPLKKWRCVKDLIVAGYTFY